MTPKVLPLKDQVVLITGSSRGLGRAIALAFARQGVLGLVINCLSHSETLDDLLLQVNPHATRVVVVKADITNANDVDRLFETAKRNFGYPITTVVNNALSACPSPGNNDEERRTIETMAWDTLDAQLRGGLQGSLNTTKAALLGMREIGFGRIINISSGATIPQHENTISKGAMLAFTHTASAELAPSNITVNLVACCLPRQIDPKVTPDSASKTPPGHRKSVNAGLDEMADTVLFFACPWARGVTGQCMAVGGGLASS